MAQDRHVSQVHEGDISRHVLDQLPKGCRISSSLSISYFSTDGRATVLGMDYRLSLRRGDMVLGSSGTLFDWERREYGKTPDSMILELIRLLNDRIAQEEAKHGAS